ncbi:MAG: 3-dehydroquinate synthase [Phycisphaeraceae bacterium]|nr:3-dehydroquinate synthase [Phycisphaeraceae bacterium]
MPAAPVTIPVTTRSGAYDAVVGLGVLDDLGKHLQSLPGRAPGRVMIVADQGIPQAMIDRARASIAEAGFQVGLIVLTPTEADKSPTTLNAIWSALLAFGATRDDMLVALGGGIVGDIAGFAAATYLRGIRVVQCPSTLLAMVDASVGGKTGINLALGADLLKNMAGCFHQPSLVLADVGLLKSLADRQFRSGLAECLKHGLLAGDFDDPALWTWTITSLGPLLSLDPDALTQLVARNVAVKARVVGVDERETAENHGRALLNLGHTFGHAIETLPNVRPEGAAPGASLLHGEAVGLGLLAAARCAGLAGLADRALPDAIAEALQACSLPIHAVGLPDSGLVLARMHHDKKARSGRIRLILPTDRARCVIRDDLAESVIVEAIDSLRA